MAEMRKVLITGGNGDIAKAIVTELESIGGFEIFAPGKDQLDVTDISLVNKYMGEICPDILINNAGYLKPVAISENDSLSEKKSIEINLFGVFNCTGAALKNNKEAIIINIGSSAATGARGEWSSYCATKAAVVMATKCWAKEGVRTLCLSPGRTATKLRIKFFSDEDQNTLLKPEQFARIVLKAIDGHYQYGINMDVNIQNIDELI